MRSRRHERCFPALLVGLVLLACRLPDHEHDRARRPPAKTAGARVPEPLKNEIPPPSWRRSWRLISRGSGYMEQYEYGKAAKAFREVRRRAPGWIPGAINLAIAC